MFLIILMSTYTVCIYYVFFLHEKYTDRGSVNKGFSKLYCYIVLLSCLFVLWFGRLDLEKNYPYETYAVCAVYIVLFFYLINQNRLYLKRYGSGNRYFDDSNNR